MPRCFRHPWPLLVTCVFVFGLVGRITGSGSATKLGPPEKVDVARQLHGVLREIHNRGADLYNTGDVAGCYRFFQGALLTARALLEQHPEVQKTIDKGMADADNNSSLPKRAFALHVLIEDVRARIRPTPAVTETPSQTKRDQ